MKAPAFWGQEGSDSLVKKLLLPFACLYSAVSARRIRKTVALNCGVPVICIGNISAGGTGKTPVALSLGSALIAEGIDVHYLSRGYGGKLAGPIKVDVNNHTALDVGDEPLLLARVAPVWIAKDRVAGAKAAVKAGAKVILMDDGFQNPSLHKDISFVVVDSAVGFGNGAVIPAGPLREPVDVGLARTDAVILIGNGQQPKEVNQLPVYQGTLKSVEPASFVQQKIVAFAGIGRPEKFFQSLKEAGAEIIEERSYPDHHPYSKNDIQDLKLLADGANASLMTTEKDWVRIPQAYRKGIAAFPVVLYWKEDNSPVDMIKEKLV